MRFFLGTLLLTAIAIGTAVSAQDDAPEATEAPTEAMLRDGQRVFEQHCVLCHGTDGKGAPELKGQLKVDPPDLTDDQWTYGDTDSEISAVILLGTPNDMEPFGAKLRERQVAHLVHYIRSLAEGESADATATLQNPTPNSAESSAAGRQSYVRFCVECHGMDGRGHTEMVEFLMQKPADLTKPDWKYGTEDATVFNIIKNGTPNDMPEFSKRFDDPAIWDIVNYMKSLRGEE